MKKILLSAFLLTALLGNIEVSGQEKIGLQKYDYVTNGDANIYQGIPNISLPLFGLDIPTAGVGINLSLSYTTESLAAYSLISDVGKGWNLSNVGSIVRNKTRMAEDYKKNKNEITSDVFNYNYPGGSGQFFITNHTISNEPIAIHLSPSNDKISFIKDTTVGKIKSFTITDTKGNTYLFDKTNINTMVISDINTVTKTVNSAFFLSKIFNVKNEEVAVIEYETTTQPFNANSEALQRQKIKKITAHGAGSIEYLYNTVGTPPPLNEDRYEDWYKLNKLVLKDARNAIVNQYSFIQNNNLTGLVNLDKNNNQIQKFSFEYNLAGTGGGEDAYGYPTAFQYCDFDSGFYRSIKTRNPDACTYGALKSIILPTGGRTEYEFESQATSSPYTTAGTYNFYPYSPLEKIHTITYKTEPGQEAAPYTVPADYRVAFVSFVYDPYGPIKPGIPRESFLDINGIEVSPVTYIPYDNMTFTCPGMFVFSGQGLLNFGVSGKSTGTIELYAYKKTAFDPNEYGNGLRIKSIKNFNPGSSTPLTYTKYEYGLFDEPIRSSGKELDSGPDINYIDGGRKQTVPVGYTNIKVTDMINGSYSKYYYKDPYNIAPGIASSYTGQDEDMKTYLRTGGLLETKETYSEGQLLQKVEMNYQFKEVALPNIMDNTNPVKKIVISKQGSTTENYISGTAKKLVSSSENTFDDTYSNMIASKETLQDGTVVEKTLLYPADKGVQKLVNANMINIPLETTTKKNGKLVGKAETKFDDSSHLYPTSVIGYNMQTQAPFTASTLDVYDAKGNLVQVTGKDGIPVTTIWGYYQTQPIAVITGASYSQVAALPVVTAAISASDADHDNPANEPALLQALENLRKDPALKNFSISASTYDLMIGVTNSISANGIRTSNIYDSANRLIKVTDAQGKVLKENQYNYKH
ncbi:hypothetical protein [Chryseobacterium arthrosphaerae]|uniref:hypothetical protein n=1 Tax=Chryseobacterium arthrosphaerae TaxID=651561 RepID=UPI001E2FC029|nr:hypothetical protein [Chryseobacterium arthrosphaerae]UEQ76959.1 hypothetical protein J8N07_01270 [Chryseobacterium arthrosphaerae]